MNILTNPDSNTEKETVESRIKPLIFFFTVLELALVMTVLQMTESNIYKELLEFGLLHSWPWTILLGATMVNLGAMGGRHWKRLPSLLTSGQALNAISWSVIGFIHLNTPIHGGLEIASGFFTMAIINVVFAIGLELYGHREIR